MSLRGPDRDVSEVAMSLRGPDGWFLKWTYFLEDMSLGGPGGCVFEEVMSLRRPDGCVSEVDMSLREPDSEKLECFFTPPVEMDEIIEPSVFFSTRLKSHKQRQDISGCYSLGYEREKPNPVWRRRLSCASP
ncbi:hypothetical protein Baya_13034 [Bagarius yarrelli]|uniref:Uncharacterized protein n=1 Tax=Bagarius yarrelli TaxID=175774 RepID=A0A556V4S8_BAGYA|nr:hypothetical protein Baya_13034 [Bagarius yarrelli]